MANEDSHTRTTVETRDISHVYAPHEIATNEATARDALRKVVRRSLEWTVNGTKKRFLKIAYPALGCGCRCYPVKAAAGEFVQACFDFYAGSGGGGRACPKASERAGVAFSADPQSNDSTKNDPNAPALPSPAWIPSEWGWSPDGLESFQQTLLRLQCEVADLLLGGNDHGAGLSRTGGARLHPPEFERILLQRWRRVLGVPPDEGARADDDSEDDTDFETRKLMEGRVTSGDEGGYGTGHFYDEEGAASRRVVSVKDIELLPGSCKLHAAEDVSRFYSLEARVTRLETELGVFDCGKVPEVLGTLGDCEEDYRDLFREYGNVRNFDAARQALQRVGALVDEFRTLIVQARQTEQLFAFSEERKIASAALPTLRDLGRPNKGVQAQQDVRVRKFRNSKKGLMCWVGGHWNSSSRQFLSEVHAGAG
eukprot:g17549.t1